MARFVEVPPDRLSPGTLEALLEEFASRDGTDYGAQELGLDRKTASLRRQLQEGTLLLLYETEAEIWDIVEREQAHRLLQE